MIIDNHFDIHSLTDGALRLRPLNPSRHQPASAARVEDKIKVFNNFMLIDDFFQPFKKEDDPIIE